MALYTDKLASLVASMNVEITKKILEKYGITMSDDDVKEINTMCDQPMTTTKTKKTCAAITTKGVKCSKKACENENFCTVHIKKPVSDKKKKPKETASSSKKKSTPPFHTHGFMSPPKDGKCELCEAHGMPFGSPEYIVKT